MSQLVLNPSVHSEFPTRGIKTSSGPLVCLLENGWVMLGNRAHVLLRLCLVSGVCLKTRRGKLVLQRKLAIKFAL